MATVNSVMDLKLRCVNGAVVLVSWDKLSHATHSPAIKDILDRLRDEKPQATAESPMELDLSQDSGTAWQAAWRVIEQPLAQLNDVLTWDNLCAVINIADKYQLLPVQQACETFLFATFTRLPEGSATTSTDSPFGHLRTGKSVITLHIPVLELLYRTGMSKAFDFMLSVYVKACQESNTPRSPSLRAALTDYVQQASDPAAAAHVRLAIMDQLLVTLGVR